MSIICANFCSFYAERSDSYTENLDKNLNVGRIIGKRKLCDFGWSRHRRNCPASLLFCEDFSRFEWWFISRCRRKITAQFVKPQFKTFASAVN